MKVILLTDVDRLGNRGELVEVQDGFARNYLLPRKMAEIADDQNLKQIENIKKMIASREAKRRQRLQALAERLGLVSLKATLKMGAEGAFGSITNADIAALIKSAGYEVDKHTIILDQPIKAPGVYDILIKLAPDITATIKLWVVEEPIG